MDALFWVQSVVVRGAGWEGEEKKVVARIDRLSLEWSFLYLAGFSVEIDNTYIQTLSLDAHDV